MGDSDEHLNLGSTAGCVKCPQGSRSLVHVENMLHEFSTNTVIICSRRMFAFRARDPQGKDSAQVPFAVLVPSSAPGLQSAQQTDRLKEELDPSDRSWEGKGPRPVSHTLFQSSRADLVRN